VDKLIQEHRKRFGEFEVIEFVDEQKLAGLRDQLNLSVPVGLNWTWTYGSEVAELRNLYEKGKVNQWNAETDLDWSIPVSNDEFIVNPELSLLAQATKLLGKDEATQKAAAFDEINYLLSQLLHGEQAALQLCGQLTNCCPTMDAKFYAASQVADEARHVEVIAKFLQRKVGTIYPIGGTLKVLLDKLLEAPTWKTKTLGMQCLFEGMAVGIMDLVQKTNRNPLIADIITRVHQDEARHAAFGILTMRRVVKESTPEERFEMEDFAFDILETLNANQQLDMMKLFGPKYGLDGPNVVQLMHSLPEWPVINSEVYMHTVIPNLVRLGLITERSESKWRDRGMMVGTHLQARSALPVVA